MTTLASFDSFKTLGMTPTLQVGSGDFHNFRVANITAWAARYGLSWYCIWYRLPIGRDVDRYEVS